jgi:hypothetical protein
MLVFSNYMLHTVYYTSGSETFSVCKASGTFGTIPYTMKILFVTPSTEMCSGVKYNAVLYYGHGCVWGTARKLIIKNISSETASFCARGRKRHWMFQGRKTAIQLAEYHCSARKSLVTNVWHNVTVTTVSECRRYFAWFQTSVEK